MYSGIRIINRYPHGKQIYQLEYSAYIQFLLLSVLHTPLFSKVTLIRTFSLTFFCEVFSYICDTVRLYCHILHSILGSPDLLCDTFKICFKIHSLYCKILWVLTNSQCHLFTIAVSIRDCFTTLKNVPCFTYSVCPPPLKLCQPLIFFSPLIEMYLFQNVI